MEALLQNGDHLLDHQGIPMQIDGIDALLQRALLRLSVKRGTLSGNPAFGSRLHQMRIVGERKIQNAQALACAREAVAPIGQISVKTADCIYDPSAHRLMVRLRLAVDGRDYTLEVKP